MPAKFPNMKDLCGVRWYSLFNKWIDFIVLVDKEDKENTVHAIGNGIEAFWNSDYATYGELVEKALEAYHINYKIFYAPSAMDENDYEAEQWEGLVDQLSKEFPIYTITE